MQPNERVGIDFRPSVKYCGQMLVHPPGPQPGLKHAHDHNTLHAREVLDVLSHEHPPLLGGHRAHLRIWAGIHTAISNMDRIMAALGQALAGRRREHFIDQEPHRSGGHQPGATLRQPPGLLGRSVIRGHLRVDLLPMASRKIDRNADVPRMQPELLG